MDSSPSSLPAPTLSSTPLQLSGGIPFSWEKLPGIPKKQPSSSRIQNATPSKTSLPPPPPSTTTTPKKHSKKAPSAMAEQSEWDPFVAAMVQCSMGHAGGQRHRDGDEKDRKGGGGGVWTVSKVSRRSISDRLGLVVSFNGYGSCKVSPAVSDSIVYVPAGARRRGDYGLVSNRHHRYH